MSAQIALHLHVPHRKWAATTVMSNAETSQIYRKSVQLALPEDYGNLERSQSPERVIYGSCHQSNF